MDIVTLGETMALMSPVQPGRLDDAAICELKVAGAESNVAIGLARLGHQVSWISRLGADPFGRRIQQTLRGEGVDVKGVEWDEHAPTGLYFKEKVHGRTRIYYYRRGSAASRMRPEILDEDRLKQAKLLFVTGITPALSSSCRETVEKVIERSAQCGIPVAFDPNYRSRLWSADQARSVFRGIASRSETVLPSLEEGKIMTGYADAPRIAETLLQWGARHVVVKLGPEGAYYTNGTESGTVSSPAVTEVDEVGAGDAFAAGCLSGLLENLSLAEAAQRGAVMGAIAVTGHGDYEALPTREELDAFMEGNQDTLR
ncbi:MAG: sugar kinase [Firmicutes bacterium]|uniref:2-dehydro-3-deoxygluconokinase n=1 Tax=Melghirimyces thermohalophilus TaxID=1236220 RepID=A0A1G6NB49_9BACL|nr:sugar kinase [Melghirimyces thermohalophilus]MDA8352405.1 sugar kinase [Bacillota bacterium]SDC64385.1 2-dehydro-3-deoxygluconokinase [Melghirimyces thermohalophilus]